ncbi:MAG: M15 family metallopeptidase [Actinomycetota bacterium]
MWGRRVVPAWLLAVALALGACTTTAPTLAESDPLPVDAGGGAVPAAPAGPLRVSISSNDKLPGAVVAAAKALPGVLRAGARRTGMVNLLELVGAEHPIPRRPAGTILPISVEAHEAALVAAFPGLGPEADALRAGQAVVPRAQAEFRGLSVGDAIVLSHAARVRVRVGAITDDERVFRSELIVPPSAADRLGLERSRAIVLAVAPAAAVAIEDALEAIVGDQEIRVRVSQPDAGTFSFDGRRLLPLAEVKMTFGEFWYRPLAGIAIAVDPAWRRANIVQQSVPLLGSVTCHRKVLPQLTGAMGELQSRGLGKLVKSFSGCYSPRMQVADDGELSRHAFGIAVDINAGSNPYGAKPRQDARIVEVMERWGFNWGGRWNTPDAMHFEFSAFPDGQAGG